ncbi:hypothetical protein lbkm_3827 [Lachnospiraceae bacterium KM106-2]|nr:hypothetical protein lbkm_3827 [Lachnospiraceae bacterium KM106-2]
MVNVNKLVEKMIENGLPIEKIAEIIWGDKLTLYLKISNYDEISIKDAERIVEVLNLTKVEANAIFFA